MALDRSKAFDNENGTILDGGAWLSSGVATPTHTGLKGDKYFKTEDGTIWSLLADGTNWVIVSAGATSLEFSNNIYSSPGENVNSSEYVIYGYGTLTGIAGTGELIAIGSSASGGTVTVRLYNRSTASEMAYVVFNTTTIARQVASVTLPSTPDIVEIQAKRTGGAGIIYAAEIS